jgi:O-antigen/teichoic acid export membrane protein
MGVSLSADNLSDLFYGSLQREERMSAIARSMMARGLLGAAGLAVALRLTGNLAAAVGGLAAGRILVLALYDAPRGRSGQVLARAGRQAQWEIFRTALPLGLVLMLVSLTSNVPRYAIEAFRGARELGAFAAVAAFLTAGSTVVNALGQSGTPRLARMFSERDLAGFRRLAWKLTGMAVLLGLAGVVGALMAGNFVLQLVYGGDYAAYTGVLVLVMVSAIFVYVAVVLGYILTSARAFLSQLPLLLLVTATSAGASWLLVPGAGLTGAAFAAGLAAVVQIAGEILLLRRSLRRREESC